MYEIMSDLVKYLVNRYALCLKGSNMPRPPLRCVDGLKPTYSLFHQDLGVAFFQFAQSIFKIF